MEKDHQGRAYLLTGKLLKGTKPFCAVSTEAAHSVICSYFKVQYMHWIVLCFRGLTGVFFGSEKALFPVVPRLRSVFNSSSVLFLHGVRFT